MTIYIANIPPGVPAAELVGLYVYSVRYIDNKRFIVSFDKFLNNGIITTVAIPINTYEESLKRYATIRYVTYQTIKGMLSSQV